MESKYKQFLSKEEFKFYKHKKTTQNERQLLLQRASNRMQFVKNRFEGYKTADYVEVHGTWDDYDALKNYFSVAMFQKVKRRIENKAYRVNAKKKMQAREDDAEREANIMNAKIVLNQRLHEFQSKAGRCGDHIFRLTQMRNDYLKTVELIKQELNRFSCPKEKL